MLSRQRIQRDYFCSFCPFKNPNRAGTVEQLVGCLPGTHKALGSVFTTTYTDVAWAAHASDPGTWGVKIGGSGVKVVFYYTENLKPVGLML